VLLAGNRHVRRDPGLPRWPGPALQGRAFSVGDLEINDAQPAIGYFDAVVWTEAARREDNCAAFKQRKFRP